MTFLDLYDGQPPPDLLELESIQIALAGDTIARCRDIGWDFSAFFRAVWAIILYRHTESHHVTFATYTGDTRDRPYNGDLRQCDLSVEPETSIDGLLASPPPLNPPENGASGRGDHNTAVIIEENDIDGGKESHCVESLSRHFQIVLLVQNTEVPRLWLMHRLSSCWDAENLASVIEQAASEVSRNPQHVKDLNLFSDHNRQQVVKWNERDRRCTKFIPITDIIRQHAVQRPNHKAICAWDGTLTYLELDVLTTKLAYYLRHIGVQEGSMVLLAFEKSMWAVVALLSVLKAGGTFVPVSPSYPPSRLKVIIDATRSSIMLTSKELAPGLQSPGVQVITFDDSLLDHLPTERSVCSLAKQDPQRPAYVLFTSGSTGTPKGCVLHHEALSTLVSQGSPLYLHSSSRVLQFVPAIFAASSIDTYLPLLVGATICIASQHDLINDIASVMKQYRVTWASMTPSAISTVEPAQLVGLETLVLAGEPVGEHTRNLWAKSVRLLSGYGLSEIVGAGAISTLEPGRHPRNIGVSPTSRIWVADPANIQRLAPVGGVGEMLIDGSNIGQGYLDDPEKTARAFVHPPEWIHDFYPEGAPHRILRTGDLVRYQPDGSLVYIGRKDTQVKIRGKRVELGEIEAQIRLRQSPMDVVIVEAAAPLDADSVVLVAFIRSTQSIASSSTSGLVGEASPQFQGDVAILDSTIRSVLPDHMIPSFYLPLARIPKTATGKMDRRALRSEIEGLTLQQLEGLTSDVRCIVQPRNDVERVLHGLFAKVIGRDSQSFGIDQKFVRLGGDSIKAMTLVRLCREQHLSLTVSDILDQGTVGHLATIACQSASSDENNSTMELQQMPRQEVMTQLQSMGISEDSVEEISLCSSIQEGILMSQLRNPDKYALRLLFEVSPPKGEQSVSVSRLQEAWARLIQHHHMLRTMFVSHVSPSVHIVQVRLKEGSLPFLRSIPNDKTPEQLLALDQTIQLYNTLPLLTLYSTLNGRVLVRMELTHAVVDGMSMAIIVRDFCKMYNSPTDSPSSFQYPKYVDHLKLTHSKGAISYWKEYLAGFDSCRLPTSIGPPTGIDPSYDEDNLSYFKSVPVDAGRMADYRRFSTDTGITTASVVKLAWALTLRAFCNTNDVCFGYLASTRDAPLEGIVDGVGPLINIMMCRMNMSQDAKVMDMLRSVQADFVRSLPHKTAALGDIRRAIGVASDEVLFNTCISQFPVTSSDTDDSISMMEILRHDPTEFDVNLEVMVFEDELRPTLKAYTTLVPTEKLKHLAAVFGHAMRTIIRQSNHEINQLDLLPPQDLLTISRWNQDIPQSVDSCVHSLVWKHCQEQPTATAVCAWDGNWTYEELDRMSSALSQKLILTGVKPEAFVPILMEKSRWVPVAMMAILKAGAAFVLLEPSQPLKRLENICDDIRPGVILTSMECQPAASTLCPEVIVLGNTNAHTLAAQAKHLQASRPVTVSPRNAAYAVFTSGSTGKPKGVVIEHRSLATSAFAMMRASPLNRSTRLLEYASFAFDVSILDLMVTLIAGGCLCVPSADARENRLLESINEFEANYIALTPTVARTLQPERLISLRTLKVSGEALLSSDIEQWSVTPHIRLINMYGPAECTINATACTSVTPGPLSSSIGHAMCSSTSWIVDPNNHHKLLPIGAVGELIIQGPIVGRGYINRPDQTEAAFIKPPAWLSRFRAVGTDERLYKTGDLVEYAHDGSLLYKGRKDFQVKLRGQRFELVEVEEHLRQTFPHASEVIAEVGTLYGNRSKTLVAFVLWGDVSDHQALDVQEGNDADLLCPTSEAFDHEVSRARAVLSASLPSFMQPTLYVPLLKVPRSRSGKTDRGRLRRIISTVLSERAGPKKAGNEVVQAPRNKSEAALLQAVAEMIGIGSEQIGLQDNFFRLGGDSVTAMSLVGILRQRGYDLTVAEIFKQPVLGVLAEKMRPTSGPGEVSLSIAPFSLLGDNPAFQEKVIQEGVSQCMVPRCDIEDIYPCSAVQGGLFMYSFLGRPDSLVVTWVYKLRMTTNLEDLKCAWTKTTQAHPILRTRIITIDGDNPQQVLLRGSPELEFIDSTDTQPELPITFASGSPLLRAAVIRRSPSVPQDRLIISLHHSIYDGWSLGLLIKELERAYTGIQLQTRPFSPFIDYVEQTYTPALDFWREKMTDLRAPIFPALPPHVGKADPHAHMIRRVSIPSVSSLQFTLSTKIRWAWARLISLYTENPDIVIMLVTTGRTAPVPDIDEVVAPTLAIFPHRVHVDRSQSLSDALHKDQVQQIETIPHEHLGSRGIVRVATGPTSIANMQFLLAVQPEEDQSQSCLYDEKEMMPQKKAFHVRALNLHCYIKNNSLELHACYDSRVLPEQEMDGVLRAFDSIFQQIFHEPQVLVDQVKIQR